MRTKPTHSVKSYAVWLLSRREYTAERLRYKLLTRGYSEPEVNDALTFTIEQGYQSDARFAKNKALSTQNRAGNLRIAMELKGKGVHKDLAIEAVGNLAPESERVNFAAMRFKDLVAQNGLTLELKRKLFDSFPIEDLPRKRSGWRYRNFNRTQPARLKFIFDS